MTETLHILNGDVSANILKRSSIEGDLVVWREMLCEGKLLKDVGSDEFWKARYDFFQNEMGVQKLEYFDRTIKELVKLQDLSGYKQVFLWFEFDLFCQINLIALCSYLLKSYRKDIVFKMICTGKEAGKEGLQSLSDYTSEEYEFLKKNSVKITRHDLLIAEQCWQVYVGNDLEELMGFNFNGSSKFSYLQRAIDQHIKRFPTENGLNEIENKILEIIHCGVSSIQNIVEQLLTWQQKDTVYGFSDSQYELHIKKLVKYYEINEKSIHLNSKGRDILI